MRWRRYFERNARDADLSQGIAHYIAQETDDNIARELSPDEARVAAIRKFGNRRAIRETVYEMNSIGWLEVVVQDLRYGLRQLRLRPGFAVAAITSLALGIGANTALVQPLESKLDYTNLGKLAATHLTTRTPVATRTSPVGPVAPISIT